MRGMGAHPDEACPINLNLDAKTFKPGDLVSYRVPEEFGDTPFVGEIVTVAQDHITLRHYSPDQSGNIMHGTRENRPVVSTAEAMK
ncbi:MAG: hypothetical protein GYB33_13670 [Gammaproteobacteria bacterium]|nr:hypothetical protein [Gammaproteobacteria bacterium]